MKNYIKHTKRLWDGDEGNTATEYAVMLSLIIIVSIGAIMSLSDKIVAIFNRISAIG